MNTKERWLLAIQINEEPNIHESQVIQDALSACLGDNILWLANTGYRKMIGSEAEAAAYRDYFQGTLDDWLAKTGFYAKIRVSLHRPEEIFPDQPPMEIFLSHVISDLRGWVPEIDDTEAQRLRRLASTMIGGACLACGEGHAGIGWQTTGNPGRVLIFPMCDRCSSDEPLQRMLKAAIDNGSPLGQSILVMNGGVGKEVTP